MAALYEPDGEILSAGRPRVAGRATREAVLKTSTGPRPTRSGCRNCSVRADPPQASAALPFFASASMRRLMFHCCAIDRTVFVTQ